MIDASGFKVLPREVEEVLLMHPKVREAVVAGVPDAYRGETVKAFVGDVSVERSPSGGRMSVAGRPVSYGIAAHARSVIEYALPPGAVRFTLADLGLSGRCRVRDVWQGRDLATVEDELAPLVPWHGAALYRLSPQR